MATDRVQIIFTTKGVTEANTQIKKLGGNAKKSAGGIAKLTTALAVLGGGLFVKTLIQTNVAFNKIETTLAALTGTTEKAAVEFQFLADEADRLGFVTTDLALNYARLSASTKGTILQGQATRDIFSAISEQARLLQLSTQDTGFAIRAITQIISKGVVTMEEMRRQLGDNLPGAFSKAAKSMGLTTSEFIELIESGNLLADEFIPRFSKFLTEDAAPGLDKVTTSLAANIERMKNSFQLFLKAIGDTGALELFNTGLGITINVLKLMTDFIKSGGITKALDSLKKTFKTQVDQLESVRQGFLQLINTIVNNGANVTLLAKVFNGVTLAASAFLTSIQLVVSGLTIVAASVKLVMDEINAGEKQQEVFDKRRAERKRVFEETGNILTKQQLESQFPLPEFDNGQGIKDFGKVVLEEGKKTEQVLLSLNKQITDFSTDQNQIVFKAPDTSALEEAFTGVVKTAGKTKELVERTTKDTFDDQIRQLSKQFTDISGQTTGEVVRSFQVQVNTLNAKFRRLRDLALEIGVDPKELEPLRAQLERSFVGLSVKMQDALEDTQEFVDIADDLKLSEAATKEAEKLAKALDTAEDKVRELVIAGGGDIAQTFIKEGTSDKLAEFEEQINMLSEAERTFSKEAIEAGRSAIRQAGDLEIAASKADDLEKAFNGLTQNQQDIVEGFVEAGENFQSTMGDMVTAALTGTGSVREIFKGFIDQLIAEVVRLAVIKPIIDLITGGATGGAGGVGGALKSIGTAFFGGAVGAAKGLDLKVGGSGGIDSQFLPLAVTPGERVTVETPTQQARNGAGGGGNVSVSVNVDGNGNATQTTQDGADPDNQARELAALVVDVIQKQKRPGGVLA
jgi:tape measure domain-containing protein